MVSPRQMNLHRKSSAFNLEGKRAALTSAKKTSPVGLKQNRFASASNIKERAAQKQAVLPSYRKPQLKGPVIKPKHAMPDELTSVDTNAALNT